MSTQQLDQLQTNAPFLESCAAGGNTQDYLRTAMKSDKGRGEVHGRELLREPPGNLQGWQVIVILFDILPCDARLRHTVKPHFDDQG